MERDNKKHTLGSDMIAQLKKGSAPQKEQSEVHIYQKGRFVCDTEARGHETPRGLSPTELVLDASHGFIPLWSKDVTLNWRFRERSLGSFTNPNALKTKIRRLLGDALLAWGDAVPVKFAEDNDAWDFEIVMRAANNCDINGCVLASSFFPDAGRHKFVVYPKTFEQSDKEQLDTLIHELGHVFGLRHFFAQLSESAMPSVIFGTHQRFSIMNYGADSELTPEDKSDLKRLYQAAWSGDLTEINGTPIRFMKPHHTAGAVVTPTNAEVMRPGAVQSPGRIAAAQQLLLISADLLSGKLGG